ncbi:thiol reductant ABC exporter subunit CydD [Aurantiacibacter xanthus]|uniref:Thiol reductant ABC exporter subunit CydD n=1 Tax=Aurantiacibacter xanthus TaxID=1784712 RepID=A0A3A1P553_9SPHN|nr:thiol reductant ABC exporter subunit CydD [Aurantiacibacter xanthus]RIV85481.1 thiol reductant ABC exporter subunit CydD [Aurantiacibacter xanthus]
MKNLRTSFPRNERDGRERGIPRLAIALQTAASLLWIAQAALIAIAIGTIADDAGAQAAAWPAAGVFALGLVRAALERAGTTRAYDVARSYLSALRARAAVAVAGRSPLDITRPSSGLVASVLTEQASAIVPYLARFGPLRFRATVVPVAILAIVFVFSWVAALVLLVAAPVIPIFMALIGWRAKAASETQLERVGDMNAFLLDRLRGLATIRAFGAVNRTADSVRANAEDLRISTMAVLRIAFLSSAVLELFASLGVALVAVYVGFHYLGELNFGAWGEKLTLAQGLFILLLAPAFFEPLRDLSSVWHDRAAGEASLEALERLAVPGPAIVGALESVAASEEGPLSVEVVDLAFRHAGTRHPVLDGLNLSIRAGEHVAFMAPSGSGKSTFLALLAGLAEPHAGAILLGGEPMDEANAARLRARIGWLGQPPHIFSGTLASNIALGRPALGRKEIDHAAMLAQIGPLAARRGGAPIGEGGAGLSGGEALRLALARAAAGSRPGLILVDEPTAHLDRATAHEITERLLALAQESTLIVATHDPTLAARVDRIIACPTGALAQVPA